MNAILLENVGNANQSLTFKWRLEDGSMDKYVINSPKEEIELFMQNKPWSEATKNWFRTVFVNFIIRNADDYIYLSDNVGNFLNVYLCDYAYSQIVDPDPKLYSGDLNDKRLYDNFISQLPSYVKEDSVIVLPFGMDMFWDFSREDDADVSLNVQEIKDYLEYLYATGQRFERMSVPDANRLAKQWHAKLSKSLDGVDKEGEDIKTILKFPDGHSVVRLISSAALKREGKVCRHCIGKGGYDEAVSSGRLKIFSLRDSSGHQYATIEVVGSEVRQIKGHSNGPVDEKVRDHVKEFILRGRLSIAHDHRNIGLSVIDEI